MWISLLVTNFRVLITLTERCNGAKYKYGHSSRKYKILKGKYCFYHTVYGNLFTTRLVIPIVIFVHIYITIVQCTNIPKRLYLYIKLLAWSLSHFVTFPSLPPLNISKGTLGAGRQEREFNKEITWTRMELVCCTGLLNVLKKTYKNMIRNLSVNQYRYFSSYYP